MEQNEDLNEYRRELKVKILDLAGKKFSQEGIRSVKMDDIAHGLVISKRTLYELYPTKEELLLAVMKRFHERNAKKLQEQLSPESNVMDVLYAFYRNRLENVSKVNPVFYNDLNKYESVRKHLQAESKKRNEKAKIFLVKGIKQGFFIPDVNADLMLELIQHLNDVVIKENLYFRYPAEVIFRHVMMSFIRGFLTEKGIKAMDKILGI